MPLHVNRWAGGRGAARPPGRFLWATHGLAALSAALLTWSVIGLVDARPTATSTVAPSVAITSEPSPRPVTTDRDRDAATLIEPPLPGPRPIRSGGATVQRPRSAVKPERITIPALGIKQDLTELAVVGRTLQVPDDYADIGWWGGGTAPGGDGAAVMVGHVDSPTGPAVFYQLSAMTRGEEIRVRLDNGWRAVFTVTDIEVYDKNDFPSARVYYRTRGRPALHLLTCGGAFDNGTRQYSSNVVVYAELKKRFSPEHEKQPRGRAGKDQNKDKKKNDDQAKDNDQDRGRSGPQDATDGERQ